MENSDKKKTKEQLINELMQLRRRITELETLKAERKREEKAFQESEARSRELFNNMSSGVAVYETVNDGEDFVFKDFNKAGEKIDNITKKVLIGKPVTEVFPGVKELGLFEVFQRVWKTGKSEHHPVSLYKDERIIGWRENFVYKLPSGEVVAVYDDITERKKAEEELRRHKEHLEKLVEKRTAELTKLNKRLQREIIARKQSERKVEHLNLVLLGIRNVNQLITRERDRDRLLKGVCDCLIETLGYHNAWIALFNESLGLVATAEAGLGRDFLTLVNMFERGELTNCARRALKQSDIVTIKDPLSTCGDCPLSEKFSGRSGMIVRVEYRGQVYGILCVSIPADLIEDEVEQSLFKEVAGDVAFALYNIEIEKEHKKAEEALKESIKQVQQSERMAATGRLAASIAHEINNPAQVIVSNIAFVESAFPDDFSEKDSMLRIKISVNRIRSTVQQLLDIHRSKIAVEEKVNVNNIIESTLLLLENQLKINKVIVKKELCSDITFIYGFSQDLHQVFMNLILNAMDAMEGGGILEIRTNVKNNKLYVYVKDYGCGITKENIEHIFEPFFTTKSSMLGTGLGLSTTKGIVESFGGATTVKSQVGKGSTFKITFPLSR